jgi:hypothetical protein
MKRFALSLLLIFLLAACAPSQATANQPTVQPAPILKVTASPTDDPALLPTLFPNNENNGELARVDEQGVVVFELTPLNLVHRLICWNLTLL